jgi:ATP-binding cassette, subfamily B, bacterial HlyB/CyaB
VRFEDVSFAFTPSSPEVLKHIDLQIPAGTFVGMVGQSGSGKSTLMKLLTRLYAPTAGRILIDHYDIDKVELYSLRRQIGIVPQDPLLFSGRWRRTLPSPIRKPAASRSWLRRAWPAPMTSSWSCRVATAPRGGTGRQHQPAASASAWRLARTLLSKPKLAGAG